MPLCMDLLFYDFQNFHGAGLDTDAAGNALGSGCTGRRHHNLHGAHLGALAAGGAQLFVDHVHTGLGILGNCTGLTGLGAFAALDTGHGLGSTGLVNDLDAGQVLMKFLIESNRTGADTFQASHALATLLNCESLHSE